MTSDRDRILSDFIDAWNAGQRPDVDDYIARAPTDEQGELAEQLVSFLSFAPTPSYDDATLDAIRAEVGAVATSDERGGVLSALLAGLRERGGLTVRQLAGALVSDLGLPKKSAPKAAGYLERLEHGELDPAGVKRDVFGALGRVFGVPGEQLEGAADVGALGRRPAIAFRAENEAADVVMHKLDLLAEALDAPGGEGRDQVDELFLGGR